MIDARTNFEAVRSEILLRVQHRDRWLTHALLVQVSLWALSHGITVGNFKATDAMPGLKGFAPLAALLFAAMYFVEDRIIARLSAYVVDLGHFDAIATAGSEKTYIPPWDGSPQLLDYAKGWALPFRVFAQLSAFIGLPVLIWTESLTGPGSLWVFLVVSGASMILVVMGYCDRRHTGRARPKWREKFLQRVSDDQ